jgi:ribosomal protein S18 acetylase RimI-like enzyme
MTMRIRPFRASDEPEVVSLWERCQLVRPQNDPHKDIQRKLASSPDLFLVGEIDGRVVASTLAGYEGHRGWLNYVAIAPELQRQGLGKAIVAEAERRLRALGCPKINLQVRVGNQGAVDFYRQLGYSVDDVVSMGKRLEVDER